MKTITAIFFVCCVSLTAFGQQVILNGKLMTDANQPVPATRISVAGGPANTTDAKGQFKLTLMGDFSEGERVIIKVIKPNWVINYPLDGEWNLPNVKLQNIQTLNVIIVPRGSKALWTHARIEKQIAKLSDEIAKLKKEGDTPRPIDFGFYLGEWAEQYGFTSEQVKAAFDEWAKAVEKSDDFRTLGLRAFYQKNFPLAAENFIKAAQKGEEQIRQIDEQRDRKTLDVYQNRKDAGNSLTNLSQFREALEQYNLAKLRLSEIIAKEKHQWEQAAIEGLIGNAKQELGSRAEGKEAMLLLTEAVDSFKRALAVFTYEQWPYAWAATHLGLGATLRRQGERAEEAEGVRLLAEAVKACRDALLVYTREQYPQQWAMTQNALGNALYRQGERTERVEGARLLVEAVKAYRDALSVYTREQLPQDWAMTRNNLGSVLGSLGERTEGSEGARLLAEAVNAYRDALSVRTREQLPQQWAATQNNLGHSLQRQGERTSGVERVRLLAEAVKAYRNVLWVYTREQLPQQWAATQDTLGTALVKQGARTEGVEGVRLLAEAVKAYHDALLVRTLEQLPQQWAATQDGLGTALGIQGERTEEAENARLLAEAVKAYRNALLVRTREQLPQQWAATQNNLGVALRIQSERTDPANRERLLRESVGVFQLSLQVHDRRYLPRDWARTQDNLGNAYYTLQDWGNAAECYANTLTIYPDYKRSFQRASSLYHETLFKFDAAFELKRRWLEANPDDLSVLPDFAENHFTTGRFAECRERITALLAQPKLDAGTKIALRLIEIANLLSLGQEREVPAKLDLLSQAVAAQPVDFKLIWTFSGTQYFIGQNEKLAPYREWLRRLFNAAQAENRDAIIKGLREAKASFK